MLFCKDVDLLHWEPDLLREAAFVSQLLAGGTADLDGSTFSEIGGPPLNTAKIEAGNIVALGAPVDGCVIITQILGATLLRVSSLYTELFPASGPAPEPAHSTVATGVPFAIRTFWAQRKIVSDLLLAAAGLEPGSSAAEDAAILNPDSLKRPAALGVLQMIYSAVAAAAPEPARYSTRADLYERLYRRALRQARVEIDLDADGQADATRMLNVIALTRE